MQPASDKEMKEKNSKWGVERESGTLKKQANIFVQYAKATEEGAVWR